jgi:hypothetical protein
MRIKAKQSSVAYMSIPLERESLRLAEFRRKKKNFKKFAPGSNYEIFTTSDVDPNMKKRDFFSQQD